MAAVNDALFDAAVRHQVYLIRYSTSVVRKIVALLNKVDADLVAQIIKRDPTAVEGAASFRRLEALLEAVREINRDAYNQVQRAMRGEMGQLAVYETGFQQRLLTGTIPVELDVTTPAASQLKAAVLARPFQGRLLKEWVSGLEASAFGRLRDAVRIGFVEGQTIDQIVRRVRGTAAQNYSDGILEISRRGAETMVRTALSHTANFAREQVYSENADLIKAVRWVSTLDNRTSAICRARDGKIYPVNEGPRPPAHPNCRSTTMPIVKSFRDIGIDIDEAPPGTRASMNGQVPADLTYPEWLKKQSAAMQDEILGKTKGALFRKGGLDVDKFVDMRSGREFTLDELRVREDAAFKRAGVQ